MNPERILIVDDEARIREMLRLTLEYESYRVEEAGSGTEALEAVRRAPPDAVILDVKMAGMDGIETLEHLRRLDPDLPVIMLTGHGTIEAAVDATRKGAFDFLAKPPDREKILIALRNALTQTQLRRENLRMREEIGEADRIVGSSSAVRALHDTIHRVAPTEAFVLITGENGTGKELVAKAVHRESRRATHPLVEVNCAAIPNDLIESELFGHEKGSFTGATAQRIGKFELANGGTLLLDEVGDMSLQAQAKVLRVLEEGSFERVGGGRLITVDVRVIAATNKDLPKEIADGRFREDLYHRLNVIPIHVPPLRERREDIPELIVYFLASSCARNKLPPRTIDSTAVQALARLPWPGNVRELRNGIERLAILVSGTIGVPDVSRYVQGRSGETPDLFDEEMTFQEFKDRSEELFLRSQLARNDWNVSRTAERLDMQRSHLYVKINRYGLRKEGSAGAEEERGG